MQRRLLMTHRSPFARKVRIALREKGLPTEETLLDLARKPGELLRSGPMQKVPVLFDGPLTIADSTVICEYLEDRYPRSPLLPHGYLARLAARQWENLGDEASEAAVHIFMQGQRRGGVADRDGVRKAEATIPRILDAAEDVLRNRAFLVGDRLTVADIAIGSTVAYIGFRLGDAWRRGRPHLSAWLETLEQRPGFAETRPRL